MRIPIVFGTFAALLAPCAFADTLLAPGDAHWAVHRALSEGDLLTHRATYAKQGMRIVSLDVQGGGSTATFAVVFKESPNITSDELEYNLDETEFNKRLQKHQAAGYEMLDQDAYALGGSVKHAAIFSKTKESRKWISRTAATRASFDEQNKKHKSDGYRLIDFDAFQLGSELRIAAIWIENKENLKWDFIPDVPNGDMKAKIDGLPSGFRAHRLESYRLGGADVGALISVSSPNPRAYIWNVDAASFTGHRARMYDQGFRIENLQVHAGGAGYSAVLSGYFPERRQWPKRNDVDAKINAFMGPKQCAPKGMSVAIAQNGKLVFIKGYGVTDDKGTAAHGGTVYRIASLAKAVTGTLGFVLKNDPKVNLDLNAIVSTWIPSLPKSFSFTLGQTLNMRAGIRHYNNSPLPGYKTSIFDALEKPISSQVAVDTMIKSGTAFGAIGTWYYSTHSYTFAARAMELMTKKATGRDASYCDLLESYLAKPQQLKIRCENRADGEEHRSDVYELDNDEALGRVASPDDGTWRFAGGGLEADVDSLAKFGARLLVDGTIVSSKELQVLTRATFGDKKKYAYGWYFGVDSNKNRWFEKSGDNQGGRSILRVYPATGLVIAIAANTKVLDTTSHPNQKNWSQGDLAEQLGDLILNNVKK